MNSYLKELALNGEPKLSDLDKKELNIYQTGLLLLASSVCEDFLDIPVLGDMEDRFSKEDGLYYTIDYLHDTTLWLSGNKRTLLVVWEIEEGSSFCPLRIEFELTDEDNFGLIVFDQTGERTVRKELLVREDGKYYSDIKDYDKLTLSDLLNK